MATPLFHPRLTNHPFGDPALYVEFRFERRGLLFDLGEIGPIAPRHLLRVTDVFVSHTHMDHFAGFDRLLRVRLGRGGAVRLYGPPGFCDRVQAKLDAYTWNLVHNYDLDFTLLATEYHPGGAYHTARFRCRSGFEREDGWDGVSRHDILVEDPSFRVLAAHLDHKVPCLAFRLEERAHVNVWKNRLDEMGLPTGPWLRDVKQAVLTGLPDTTLFTVRWKVRGPTGATWERRRLPLGELKERVLRVTPGQVVAYVVDAGHTAENAAAITALAKGADLLYIEAAFLEEHRDRAEATHHLTARQAGELARAAGVKRMVPFHFSTRYGHDESPLVAEAEAAFSGGPGPQR